jgi:hypothetical protein
MRTYIIVGDVLARVRALQKDRKALIIAVPHEDEDLLLDDVIEQVARFGEIIVAKTLPDAVELL